MSEAKHAPLPWIAGGNGMIWTADKRTLVAVAVGDNAAGNARLIVEAVAAIAAKAENRT